MLQDIFDYTINNPFEVENSVISNNFNDDGNPDLKDFSLSLSDFMKIPSLANDNEDHKNIEFKILYIQKEKKEQENNTIPQLYTLKNMKDLLYQKLPKKSLKYIKKLSFSDQNLQIIEDNISDKALLGKKRKKKSKIKNEQKRKRQGRKAKEDLSLRKHNKFCGDNIIKKIKRMLLDSFLKLVNKVINENLDSTKLTKYNKILRPSLKKNNKFENLLKIIDYKYIDRLNKKIDLLMLNMPFKEIFSKEISPRFSKLNPDSNKIIIKQLLKEEKHNDNLLFVLNLKFRDWLDIFTYKKAINSLINYKEEKMANIKNSFEYVDSIINDIYNNNRDNNYLLYFMIYLYNYERWFFIKRGRIGKINKNNN